MDITRAISKFSSPLLSSRSLEYRLCRPFLYHDLRPVPRSVLSSLWSINFIYSIIFFFLLFYRLASLRVRYGWQWTHWQSRSARGARDGSAAKSALWTRCFFFKSFLCLFWFSPFFSFFFLYLFILFYFISFYLISRPIWLRSSTRAATVTLAFSSLWRWWSDKTSSAAKKTSAPFSTFIRNVWFNYYYL